MIRPPKEKRIIRVKPHISMLELAYFLKTSISITYTKMLTFAWKDVKTINSDCWEIIDPIEFGTYYKVPRILLQDVADFIFGDYPINPNTLIFLGNVHHKRKISRSMLSNALQDFEPSFTCNAPSPKTSVQTNAVVNQPEKEEIEIETLQIDPNLEVPDILNDYSMFDPDKF